MKAKTRSMLLRIMYFGFLTMTIVSCADSTGITPSAPNPTSTHTPLEIVQPSVTFTSKPTLVNTPTSQKTSLSGTVFLTDPARKGGWILLSYAELLAGDIIKVAEHPDEESRPQLFIFENIEPGIYQLWVLIPPDTAYLKNCYDIGLPDKTWKLGKIVGKDRIFMSPDKSYREVFSQAVADHPADSKAHEFYAVLESIDIKSGIDNYVDATFVCKDR